MSWAIIGASVVSAGAGVYGSQQAAGAQENASKRGLDLQQQQYNSSLQMLEPSRALGYGALSDLASLYGYQLPGYTPIGQLGSAGAGMGGTVRVGGREDKTDWLNPAGAFGLGGNQSTKFGAIINPLTGQVDVRSKKDKHDERATAYLRGEDVRLGGKFSRIRKEIDRLHASGYEYDPNAATAVTAGPIAADPAAPADPMARFQASPDYEFRRSEGLRGIEQGAAARGGALSGNALRATTGFSSNLASGEYNNYVNRLMSMAGLGQVATNNAQTAGTNYANAGSRLLQNQGDARASGVMGAANSVGSAVNSGLNLYALQQYLGNQNTPAAPPTSAYGPLQGGYGFAPGSAPVTQPPSWLQSYLGGR